MLIIIKLNNMDRELIDALSKYVTLTDEFITAIQESAMIRRYKKGTILLKEGHYCNECYFILKGCIRAYCLKNGEEITTDFFTEEQVVLLSIYGKNTPSNITLECMEETLVSFGTPEFEKEMYQKYPILVTFNNKMAEILMAKFQDSHTEFKLATPEERYLNLIKIRPDLIQRVPQHQIASYLGMKPETLSRIRRRILEKKK